MLGENFSPLVPLSGDLLKALGLRERVPIAPTEREEETFSFNDAIEMDIDLLCAYYEQSMWVSESERRQEEFSPKGKHLFQIKDWVNIAKSNLEQDSDEGTRMLKLKLYDGLSEFYAIESEVIGDLKIPELLEMKRKGDYLPIKILIEGCKMRRNILFLERKNTKILRPKN